MYYAHLLRTKNEFVGRGNFARQTTCRTKCMGCQAKSHYDLPCITRTEFFLLDDPNSLKHAGELQLYMINPSVFLLFLPVLVGFFTFVGIVGVTNDEKLRVH